MRRSTGWSTCAAAASLCSRVIWAGSAITSPSASTARSIAQSRSTSHEDGMNIFGLIVDGVVMALLIVTVVYCTELNRRLKALHTDQNGLRGVVEALDRATDRAQASITELRTLGAAAAQDLRSERERADTLLEE